jgi:DNA adenine methylase
VHVRVERPALRYHGGKWRLAPWILRHMPEHRYYVEPYGGAGSILLAKWRSYSEVINDVDGEVVNFFRVLRDPGQASRLAELLSLTPYARDEFTAAYAMSADPVERARRTAVRSQMGFGSDSTNCGRRTGFRSTRSHCGTAPAVDWSRFPEHVPAFVARLAGVVIDNRDGRLVMLDNDSEETLHYIDPPYMHRTRSEKRGYAYELTDGDHVRIADTVHGLRGMVLVSGYRCELYDDLYADYHRVDRATIVFRSKRAVESLWMNQAAVAALEREGVTV